MAEGSSSNTQNLEASFENFIEISRQIGIMVSDFKPGCQSSLNEKMNGLIECMRDIEKEKGCVADKEVPREIFQYIDQGRNPQLYTKDCLHKVVTKNQVINSKTEAYRNFKDILEEELIKELPQTMDKHSQFKKQQYIP